MNESRRRASREAKRGEASRVRREEKIKFCLLACGVALDSKGDIYCPLARASSRVAVGAELARALSNSSPSSGERVSVRLKRAKIINLNGACNLLASTPRFARRRHRLWQRVDQPAASQPNAVPAGRPRSKLRAGNPN